MPKPIKEGTGIRIVSADDKAYHKFHIDKFGPKQKIALLLVKVSQIAGGGSQDSIWIKIGLPEGKCQSMVKIVLGAQGVIVK